MTDFMKILHELTCVGDQRAKGAQFQSTCKLCRESHKTQVWLCFLVLSLLSISTCAAEFDHPDHLPICLKDIGNLIKNSDAMLYAPTVGNRTSCMKMIFDCYISELEMVMREEAVPYKHEDCIDSFKTSPLLDVNPNDRCPKCEDTSTLANITTFQGRLKNLLQEITTTYHQQKKSRGT